MRDITLITVTGPDRPGITAALTSELAAYNVNVLDIGQSVIHNSLSLGFLIEIPDQAEESPVFRKLLFRAHDLGLTIRFTPISADSYEAWVDEQGSQRHIITLLGRQITARHIQQVAHVVAARQLSIDHITRLSGRRSLARSNSQPRACIEFSVRGSVPDLEILHREVLQSAKDLDLDIAIQEDNLYRRNRKLVCFDMDSTLIQAEVINELARAAGVVDQVAAITESAMNGEIDFNESFRRRVALLKGLDEGVLQSIAESLPITEGAERLLTTLQKLGYKTAILSGGFTYFAHHLQVRFGIDYVYANHLDIEDGKVTGRVTDEIVDGQMKANYLRSIAHTEGLTLDQVIAVGDGANDLPMLSIAGLGIAFHAKPIVKEQAQHSIATLGLDSILYLLGMRDRELATG